MSSQNTSQTQTDKTTVEAQPVATVLAPQLPNDLEIHPLTTLPQHIRASLSTSTGAQPTANVVDFNDETNGNDNEMNLEMDIWNDPLIKNVLITTVVHPLIANSDTIFHQALQDFDTFGELVEMQDARLVKGARFVRGHLLMHCKNVEMDWKLWKVKA